MKRLGSVDVVMNLVRTLPDHVVVAGFVFGMSCL
jgi:hypothetical protein